MNPLHLRRYRPDDRMSCLLLFEGNIPGYFLPHEIPAFMEFLDTFKGPYLVVEDQDRQLLGCGGMAEDPDFVTLCWGLVAGNRQRQGVGRLLLRARLALAVINPMVRFAYLNTSQRTEGFFAREGFKTRRVVEEGYGPGLHRHDMELRLDDAVRARLGGFFAELQAAGHRMEMS